MKVLFIGVYADTVLIDKLNNKSSQRGSLSVAAIKYTRLIGEGFKHSIGEDSTNLFLIPIGMFPICKMLIWNKKKIDGNYYIPFVNVIFLKQLSITVYLFYFAVMWYFRNAGNEKKVIIFSFLYLPFLVAIAPLKCLKNIYVASFVPDMPEYEFSYSKNKSLLKEIFIPLYINLSKKFVRINDFYIFITKYMKNSFEQKPFQIIEGFSDAGINATKVDFFNNKNALMHAGALFEKFGLRLLLEAFYEIEGNYELWLFGSGDMEKEIELYSLKDSRIKYFGNLPNDEILKYEKKAKLLINPRFTDNEFTKYSFPSKLMEYMSSGTPVLTTKLLGIPNDYFDKMFYIESETVEGFKKSIIDCLSKSQEELNLFGNNAKFYVLKEKSNFIQIKKLVKIMNEKLSK